MQCCHSWATQADGCCCCCRRRCTRGTTRGTTRAFREWGLGWLLQGRHPKRQPCTNRRCDTCNSWHYYCSKSKLKWSTCDDYYDVNCDSDCKCAPGTGGPGSCAVCSTGYFSDGNYVSEAACRPKCQERGCPSYQYCTHGSSTSTNDATCYDYLGWVRARVRELARRGTQRMHVRPPTARAPLRLVVGSCG